MYNFSCVVREFVLQVLRGFVKSENPSVLHILYTNNTCAAMIRFLELVKVFSIKLLYVTILGYTFK
jgi:hypothetical protein